MSARQFGDQPGKLLVGGDRLPQQPGQPRALPQQPEDLPKDDREPCQKEPCLPGNRRPKLAP